MTRIGRYALESLLAAVLLAGSAGAVAPQQPVGPRGMGPRSEAQEQRRARLERQVRENFVAQLARHLELTAEQREHVAALLERGAEERRAVALESRRVRQALMHAVRTGDASDATYEDLMERLRAVRLRERAIEDREDAALSEVLHARQHATYLVLRAQFNERVRGMRGGPPPGRGPGSGAGPCTGPGR